MSDDTARARLLRLCRMTMPSAAGVVLATLGGVVVAHEESRVADPVALATRAARERPPNVRTSALVNDHGSLYLVVFVPTP